MTVFSQTYVWISLPMRCRMRRTSASFRGSGKSAVIFALSAALYGRVDIEAGVVRQGNFNDHPILTLAETPRIETHLVASTNPPGGVGEPGTPPLAPAVANALFVLTGQRQRGLPLSL